VLISPSGGLLLKCCRVEVMAGEAVARKVVAREAEAEIR
jgi:hypothetical protein